MGFVNKPKFRDDALCVLIANGRLHTSDFTLLANFRTF